MLTLAQRVADPLTGDAEFCRDTDEVGSAMDHLGIGDGHIEASKPSCAPTSQEGSVSNLGDGLEG